MATNQVKFIQIGNNTTKYNKTTYTEKLDQAKRDFPGAVIFGTYFNDKDKQLQEIWANGQSYSVGSGSSNFEYFYGDIDVVNGELTNLVTIENEVTTYHVWNSAGDPQTNSFSPEHGYIYVYTRPGNNEGIEAKTAYVYDENATLKNSSGTVTKTGLWKALSGNVNAENVWFPNGIQRNAAWGIKTAQDAIIKECVGKNLTDVLDFYLVKESYPTISASNITTTAAPTYTLASIAPTLSRTSVVARKETTESVIVTWTKPGTPTFNGVVNTTSKSYSAKTTIAGMTYGWSDTTTSLKKKDIPTRETSTVFATYTETVPTSTTTLIVGVFEQSNQQTSVNSTNGSVSYTYTIPTTSVTNGTTVTFSSGGTYVDNYKLTWTSEGSSVTSVAVPAIPTTYIASNKYNLDSSHTTSANAVTRNLPLKATYSHKTCTLTYKVYHPVIYKKLEGEDWVIAKELQYFGVNGTAFSFQLGTKLDSGTYTQFEFYIPDTASLKQVTLDGNPMELKTHYVVSDTPVSGEYGLSYKKITFTKQAAGSAEATLAITLN